MFYDMGTTHSLESIADFRKFDGGLRVPYMNQTTK